MSKKVSKKITKKKPARSRARSATMALAAAPASHPFCNGNDKVWIIGDENEYSVLHAAITYWEGRPYLIARIDYGNCNGEPAWAMTTR